MPRFTSAKWDRTLILNIPIFIAIWLGLRATLEIHFRLIIRHRVLGYRLNTYRLEVQGTQTTLGGGNSTLTSNLEGSSLGVTQLAPLEMAPWAGTATVMSRLHMESELTVESASEIC